MRLIVNNCPLKRPSNKGFGGATILNHMGHIVLYYKKQDKIVSHNLCLKRSFSNKLYLIKKNLYGLCGLNKLQLRKERVFLKRKSF